MEVREKMLKPLRKLYRKLIIPYRIRSKRKIFCIGRNKTGTTSLKRAFEDLGYVVGNQRKAEHMLPDYKRGSFEAIIDYCKTAEVFQDFPFSFPNTFKQVDQAFPNAKFILTIRDNPEQWYNSLVKFHSKLFGQGSVPTVEQLKSATYVFKGFIWECNQLIYGTPENNPYRKDLLIKSYIEYNESVLEYFKNRPEDLLVINLADKNSYHKLIEFLGITSPFDDFPWVNKTKEIKVNK